VPDCPKTLHRNYKPVGLTEPGFGLRYDREFGSQQLLLARNFGAIPSFAAASGSHLINDLFVSRLIFCVARIDEKIERRRVW